MKTSGLDALASFSIEGYENKIVKTYITQEMLKRGYLAGMSIYVSIAHTERVLNEYIENLNEVFRSITKLDNQGLADKIEGNCARMDLQD